MFIAVLFIIAQTWKQLRCPSVSKWIHKVCYIQTMEYYSALKRNELSSHEKTWRKVKCILISGTSQCEKATYYMTPNYMTFLKRQKHGDSKKISGSQGWRAAFHCKDIVCLPIHLLKDIWVVSIWELSQIKPLWTLMYTHVQVGLLGHMLPVMVNFCVSLARL